MPRHLYIARLDALGICSSARFDKFMAEDFLKLGREERQAFYAMSLKRRHGKEPYAAFLVWVIDNRPVFEHREFPWHWADGQPVTVFYVSVSSASDRVDAFIRDYGLDLVADDTPDYTVFHQFGGQYVPHFVVINGG